MDECAREKEDYYVWTGAGRQVSEVEAASASAAADLYASRNRVSYVATLHVVAVRDVRSFGITVKGGGC